MDKILNLTYASSLTDLCEINSSFDSGVLRIAYAGENRNGSFISKQTFEKCMPTIFNCPVVCNYDVETDTIGGHDMDLVHSDNGALRLINLTQPVGVVPQNSKVYWENVTEEDGTIREYLCAEVLIWKRQAAYQKLKDDGITAQSMEITVKDGALVDNIYYINDFEFTAFALIGVEPCFESASLTFAKQNFEEQMAQMMREFKESLQDVSSLLFSKSDTQFDKKTEGGESLEKTELFKKYNVDIGTVSFSVDDLTPEELEAKLIELTNTQSKSEDFELTSNVTDEIYDALSTETVQREWGDMPRYCYVDCDLESNKVYCFDTNDWKLYGFDFAKDGDRVAINFDTKKRMKYAIVDFDEGEQTTQLPQLFDLFETKIGELSAESTDIKEKFDQANAQIATNNKELEYLRQFKEDTDKQAVESERKDQIKEVFSNFTDLDGVEAFEALKTECDNDCMKYELDALEEKCFAIRGRQGAQLKFNAQTKEPKIKIPKEPSQQKPYGGIFEEYGFADAD